MSSLPMVLLLLALVGASSAPAAIAKAIEVKVYDPARDIILSRAGLLIPVDSIDIREASVVERPKGMVGGSISVVDMSRQGLEDRAFVFSEHRLRFYSLFATFADDRLLILVLATIDDGSVPFATGAILSPQGVIEVSVSSEVDAATSTVRWTLDRPIESVVTGRAATAVLYGCDDLDTCDPSVAAVQAMDAAPNEIADPYAVVILGASWAELLPADDGSVPKSPVSPAVVYEMLVRTVWPS